MSVNSTSTFLDGEPSSIAPSSVDRSSAVTPSSVDRSRRVDPTIHPELAQADAARESNKSDVLENGERNIGAWEKQDPCEAERGRVAEPAQAARELKKKKNRLDKNLSRGVDPTRLRMPIHPSSSLANPILIQPLSPS
jgi:hypothetical protein